MEDLEILQTNEACEIAQNVGKILEKYVRRSSFL